MIRSGIACGDASGITAMPTNLIFVGFVLIHLPLPADVAQRGGVP